MRLEGSSAPGTLPWVTLVVPDLWGRRDCGRSWKTAANPCKANPNLCWKHCKKGQLGPGIQQKQDEEPGMHMKMCISSMEGTLSGREGMIMYCRHVSVVIVDLLYIDRQMLKHPIHNFRGFCLGVLFPSRFFLVCFFFSVIFFVCGFCSDFGFDVPVLLLSTFPGSVPQFLISRSVCVLHEFNTWSALCRVLEDSLTLPFHSCRADPG